MRNPTAAQSLAELAMYSGPDRTERLIAGAKKEGVVNGLFVDDGRRHEVLVDAFQRNTA